MPDSFTFLWYCRSEFPLYSGVASLVIPIVDKGGQDVLGTKVTKATQPILGTVPVIWHCHKLY